jgi:hypothetical protein
MQILNPFDLNLTRAYSAPDAFCPRPDLEKVLERACAGRLWTVVDGDRRMGKSSAIIADSVRHRRPILHVDLMGVSSEQPARSGVLEHPGHRRDPNGAPTQGHRLFRRKWSPAANDPCWRRGSKVIVRFSFLPYLARSPLEGALNIYPARFKKASWLSG